MEPSETLKKRAQHSAVAIAIPRSQDNTSPESVISPIKEQLGPFIGPVQQAANDNNEVSMLPTPAWVIGLCPLIETSLPAEIVREMEQSYENELDAQTRKQAMRITKKPPEETAIAAIGRYLNNFGYTVVHKEQLGSVYSYPNGKIKRDNGTEKMSNLLAEQTWTQFCAAINDALEENSITTKELINLGPGDTSNPRLLPVFITLRKKGYKAYPDLAI